MLTERVKIVQKRTHEFYAKKCYHVHFVGGGCGDKHAQTSEESFRMKWVVIGWYA